ncbi:protein shisa-5 isoform X2 [Bradysia coprophila]|uniref:protein shisa-5 isoform X2 n=1 Tax=Bradysia coprophila TaxID=38358 RepID=UPI00187DA880|nr:protein shisa-5 isoform X2 [Bradysia coprophila]
MEPFNDTSENDEEFNNAGFAMWLFVKIILFCTPFAIWYFCFRRCRRTPVVVTTATQQVPFTPGSQMHQTNIYPNQIPYPMGQQGYGMPMPASNQQSYPMPQAGYQPYPAGGAPYPPGPHENMNPPSYDQVVGTTTTTTENYAKQAPYNPSYPG